MKIGESIVKVIQIMDNFSVGGGVNSFVYDLCYALKEDGCDIFLIGILSIGNDNNPEVEKLRNQGIQVECLGASGKLDAIFNYMGKLETLIREIAGNENTICNLHLKLGVLMGILATRGIKNVRCVETYHSQYSHYWLQNKILSPFISMYVPCSESAKDEFVKRFHPQKGKVFVIPNGVNRTVLRAQVTERKEDRTISVISVGRFTAQKNLHITAKAFSNIENGDFEYKIYGDGILKTQIIEAANESTKVKLCGTVSRRQIINELANASMVVMPSLWEGLSIFMLEALALDCPMMISDVPSLRDVFNEKPLATNEEWRCCEWGYLVNTSNVKAYHEAMEHFLENRSMESEMKKNIEKYSQKYSMDEVAKKYKEVYRLII